MCSSAGFGIVGTVIVLFAIFLCCSISRIEAVHVGIKLNRWSMTLDDTLYTNGYKWVGFWGTFIQFPTSQLTMDFYDNANSITARSNDGLEIVVQAEFFYTLDSNHVRDLYVMALDGWEDLITVRSRDIIRNVTSSFPGSDFVSDIGTVRVAMFNQLQEGLASLYVNVDQVTNVEVDLPDDYQSARDQLTTKQFELTTVKTKQNTTTAGFSTMRDTAEQTALADVNKAQGDKDAAVNVARGQMSSLKSTVDAQADLIAAYMTVLSSPEAVVEKLHTDWLGNLGEGGNLIVNLPGADSLMAPL
eukprot:gnl/Dysnectes_brevis/494_a547_3706.p1 GENE.gnl/Dysnectes_brevis/494_a547_3706~~gnl/Dysnectes_brevis/494_a547_3706.p1  ORF type:complete len:302 (-),score=89.82 gnl/Dysnectes_brevis/494_a547_3706:375-1280(-)